MLADEMNADGKNFKTKRKSENLILFEGYCYYSSLCRKTTKLRKMDQTILIYLINVAIVPCPRVQINVNLKKRVIRLEVLKLCQVKNLTVCEQYYAK